MIRLVIKKDAEERMHKNKGTSLNFGSKMCQKKSLVRFKNRKTDPIYKTIEHLMKRN